MVWSTGLMQNPLVEKLVRKGVPASALPAPSSAGGAGAQGAPRELQLDKDRKTGGIVVDDRFRARLVDAAPAAAPAAAEDGAEASSSPSSSSSGPPGGAPQPGQRPLLLLPDVFVIGDCAVIDSQPALPKTAQVASQEAAHLARALNRRGTGSNNLDEAWGKPFRFRNLGTMTYLGNWQAIHQSSADRLTGYAAWVLWRTAYLTRSMSLKNKVLIPVYVSWRHRAFLLTFFFFLFL